MRGVKTKKGKLILLFIIIIALILLIIKLTLPIFGTGFDPEPLAKTAITQLNKTPALSFSTISHLTVGQETREYGNITGEILTNGDFHLQGKILGSDMELYKIKENLYRLDTISGRWFKTQEAPEIFNSALFNETDPLAQFDFADFGEITDYTTLKDHTYQISFAPVLKNGSLSQYFTNISYTIVCTKDKKLQQSTINAGLANNSIAGILEICTKFEELPADFAITPPLVE